LSYSTRMDRLGMAESPVTSDDDEIDVKHTTLRGLETDEEEIAIEAKLRQLPPAPVSMMMSKSRSAYSALSGSATTKPNFECGGESSTDSDSDAEFTVHPSLKGLTKTMSEYSVPRIRAKPSDFELNLSRMLRSTEKFMQEETEMPVPSFSVSIDQSWPAPDEPPRRKRQEQKKASISCWSSPPNLYEHVGDEDLSLSSVSATCWSAPDISNDYDEEREEDSEGEEDESEDDGPLLVRAYMRGDTAVRRASNGSEEGEGLIFADSYPVIDTTDPESSSLSRTPQCSDVEELDDDDEAFRPSSPTFDEPPPRPVAAVKRTLQQCDLGDSQDGADCRPTKDLPSPSRIRLLRSSLHDSAPNLSGLVPRERQTTLADKIERPAVHDRPSSLLSSDHSALDEEERMQLREREEWLERGSRMQLFDYDDVDVEYRMVEGGAEAEPRSHHLSPGDERLCQSEYGHSPTAMRNNQRDFYETAHAVLCGANGELRRSTTTDAIRRSSSRRRLPQRPDHAVGYHDHMPSSISMYERSIRDHEDDFDYRCGTAAGFGRRGERMERGARQGSIRSLREEHAMRSRAASARDLQLLPPPPQPSDPLMEDPRMSGSWEYRDHRESDKHLERIPLPPPPIQVMNRPPDLAVRPLADHSLNIRPLQVRGDHTPSYSDLKTPISPNVLPSPAGSGRRLPQLPYHNHSQGHSSPPFLYRMNTKEEHRLCYGMDQSGLYRNTGAAEFEEDGLNGNSSYGVYHGGPQRKTLFSMDDSSGVSSCTNSDHQIAPTHRAQSAFHARHHDEVSLEIGDAVRVDRQFDDHWSQGVNLRSGLSGIFPSAIVVEIDVIEEICQGALPTNTNKILTAERDTFYLTLLASIEVGHHKGNDVLVQAMNKVLAMYKRKEEIIVPQTVLMEISFR
ncbi:hypothetical protein PMAYCL1PPCAC_09219, partial [Pristionchus mayeri]